jgi:hypothetical protein
MNDRIKRLAIQADLITHEVPNGLAHLHTEKDIEKFAELIVQECISAGIETGILVQDWNYPAYIEALKKRGLYGS